MTNNNILSALMAAGNMPQAQPRVFPPQAANATASALLDAALNSGGGEGPGTPKPPTKDERILINDLRKKLAASEVDMYDNARKTGEYSKGYIQHIVSAGKRLGLDPLTTLAVAMQETKIGNLDGNLGHILLSEKEKMDKDQAFAKLKEQHKDLHPEALAMAYFLKNKLDISKNKWKDEARQLQFYNGMGTISPKTEADYHKSLGLNPNIMYGLDLTKTGPINMAENPLYGKSVIDLRDNVLKQNPELLTFINDTISGKAPLIPYSLAQGIPTQAKPEWAGAGAPRSKATAARPADTAWDGSPVELINGEAFVRNNDDDLVPLFLWNNHKMRRR